VLKQYPLTLRFVLFIVVPLLALAAWGISHLSSSLPQQDGTLAVTGLRAPVEIHRDSAGVPSIVASNDRDAFFALGYAHAQDRMWQLELQRRIASGRLSEVFGKDSIDQDIWFRTLGLQSSAREAWKALSPQARDSLQAYADGVNAWLAGHPSLPLEFSAMAIKPEPWSVYDSLAWIKVFALNLGGNYRQEVEHMLARQMLDPHKFAALYPNLHAEPPIPAPLAAASVGMSLQRMADFQEKLERDFGLGGRYVGSNAWAVSGHLTGNGAAMLANDPHLGLQIPSLWYMAAIKGDRIDARGATIVGLPVVIFGRNQHIAWGGTNSMADVQDLYFEEADPDDANRYRTENGWEGFKSTTELIAVRQDFPALLSPKLRPLRIQVRSTRHGPVVSDLFKVFDAPVSMRWTALDTDDTSYEAFYRLNYAEDWSGFRHALAPLVAPALNLLYADDTGNIGMLTAGRIPIRTAGGGDVPVSGWDGGHAWRGYIAPEAMPSRYNPPSGVLVSANEKFFDSDYPYPINGEWAPPDRARRIEHLLLALKDKGGALTPQAMGRIQTDTVSEPARRLLARMLRLQPSNDQQRRAFALLRTWNGDMSRDSRAASIFNAWVQTLRRELMADELGGSWNRETQNRYVKSVAGDVDLDTLGAMLVDGPDSWCQNLDTPEPDTCDEVLDSSLNDALWELLKMTGDSSMDDWAWGKLHATVYKHTPFSSINVLRSVFERSIASGGSPDTVNVASYRYDRAGRFTQDFGAGFRQVMALGGKGGAHLYINSTGQSGNVVSAHYDDMVEPFRDGVLRAWPSASAGQALRLTPASPGHVQDPR